MPDILFTLSLNIPCFHHSWIVHGMLEPSPVGNDCTCDPVSIKWAFIADFLNEYNYFPGSLIFTHVQVIRFLERMPSNPGNYFPLYHFLFLLQTA